MDYSINIDADGTIDAAYYDNAIRDSLNTYIDKLHYSPDKLTSNNMLALASHIYKAIFKPDKPQFMNKKCNIPYTAANMEKLLDIYMNISLDYNCLPSLFTFERMTGITAEVLKGYVTDASMTTLKTRQEYLINRLNESNIGVLTLANNEQSTGLMYNRQNILDHASVKQSLDIRDLVKLPNNSKQAD